MKRATPADIDKLFADLDPDDSGLSTDEIVAGLRDAGFDADREWFWQEVAPQMAPSVFGYTERH